MLAMILRQTVTALKRKAAQDADDRTSGWESSPCFPKLLLCFLYLHFPERSTELYIRRASRLELLRNHPMFVLGSKDVGFGSRFVAYNRSPSGMGR